MKIPIRWNVLMLFAIAFGSLLAVYASLLLIGIPGSDAYEYIREPLGVLIGGALALSKDLVPLGLSEKTG